MKCPHCQQDTIRQVGQSIDCSNPLCDGYTVTLAPEKFMALTAADFASYKAGRSDTSDLDREIADFNQRMKDLEIERLRRAANRRANPSERTFG